MSTTLNENDIFGKKIIFFYFNNKYKYMRLKSLSQFDIFQNSQDKLLSKFYRSLFSVLLAEKIKVRYINWFSEKGNNLQQFEF